MRAAGGGVVVVKVQSCLPLWSRPLPVVSSGRVPPQRIGGGDDVASARPSRSFPGGTKRRWRLGASLISTVTPSVVEGGKLTVAKQ